MSTLVASLCPFDLEALVRRSCQTISSVVILAYVLSAGSSSALRVPKRMRSDTTYAVMGREWMRAGAAGVASPSMHAQFYDELMLARAHKPWAPATSSRGFKLPEPPAAGAPEVAVVQPHMTELLTVHLPGEQHCCVFVDRHDAVSFGTRKPDFVAYVAARSQPSGSAISAASGSGTTTNSSASTTSAAEPGVTTALIPVSLDTAHVVLIGDVKCRRCESDDGGGEGPRARYAG